MYRKWRWQCHRSHQRWLRGRYKRWKVWEYWKHWKVCEKKSAEIDIVVKKSFCNRALTNDCKCSTLYVYWAVRSCDHLSVHENDESLWWRGCQRMSSSSYLNWKINSFPLKIVIYIKPALLRNEGFIGLNLRFVEFLVTSYALQEPRREQSQFLTWMRSADFSRDSHRVLWIYNVQGSALC